MLKLEISVICWTKLCINNFWVFRNSLFFIQASTYSELQSVTATPHSWSWESHISTSPSEPDDRTEPLPASQHHPLPRCLLFTRVRKGRSWNLPGNLTPITIFRDEEKRYHRVGRLLAQGTGRGSRTRWSFVDDQSVAARRGAGLHREFSNRMK